MAGYIPVGRRRGTGNRPQLLRGLGFVVIGAALLATLWPTFTGDMGWSGRSGTLTVSSCALGAGSHPVNTCQGDLRLSDDPTVHHGAWVTTQNDYQPGSAIPVRAGTDGSLQTATGSDRLAVGFGVLMCCAAVAVGLTELVRLATTRHKPRR
ncbi:hypothetical protein ABH940_006145 [Streptacidiphilus sp. BW17]|uniref:hypothetical protein n=1 Tax=Streptacidiphilus sp. BW17 TaxID=3156274 RepID=UPI00351936C1